MNCDVPALWQEHKEALYFFIRKRVSDDATAEDVSQEVLLKVYHFCCCKSGIRNVRSWLFQIAHNTVIDYYRKKKKTSLLEDSTTVWEMVESAAFQDAAEYILPMLHMLPPAYAEPVRMRDVEGIKLKNIAEQLGIGLPAVKQKVSRGRKMLKNVFTECCLLELDAKGGLLSFDIRPDCKSLQTYKAYLQSLKNSLSKPLSDSLQSRIKH